MKKLIIGILTGAFALIFPIGDTGEKTNLFSTRLHAGDSREARLFYEQYYAEILTELQFGTVRQKARAARILGTRARLRDVRPLGEELISGLEDGVAREYQVNDPFIKSVIAWAIGNIGNEAGVPYLIQAIDFAATGIEEHRADIEERRQIQQAAEDPGYEIILERNRPGPAQLARGPLFPASPDVYWSTADDLKAYPGINPEDETVWLAIRGYNNVNLVEQGLMSLGMIGGEEAVEALTRYVEHPYEEIRMAAAMSLGRIGTEEGLDTLETRFEAEESQRVQVRIAFSILMSDRTRSEYFYELLDFLKSTNRYVRLETAQSLRDLAIGEALHSLSDALALENDTRIRRILEHAIHNAEVDNLLPANTLIEPGPSRIWTYGYPYTPRD